MLDEERVEIPGGFGGKLRKLLPNPCFDRPFECDGLPKRCNVMLIGENPATDLGMDWWAYWTDTDGRDKKLADDAYLEARKELVEGKWIKEGKRVKLISPTHARTTLFYNRLRDGGSRLLVTNVYRNGHPTGAGTKPVSNLEILDLLLAHMPRLAVVIVHGKKASRRLPRVIFPPGIVPDKRAHFSRGWSYRAITDLADEVLQAVATRRKAI